MTYAGPFLPLPFTAQDILIAIERIDTPEQYQAVYDLIEFAGSQRMFAPGEQADAHDLLSDRLEALCAIEAEGEAEDDHNLAEVFRQGDHPLGEREKLLG